MATSSDIHAIPVLSAQAPPERADAARNRRRIMCAAERLFAERGVDSVSMEAIAQAAEVGKGTLFRRFGDRASLVRALLDVSEIEFQEGFIRGPAPLGPGAPPRERLIAFGHGLLDLLEERGDLMLAAEGGPPGRRFNAAVYGAYRAHVTMLLRAGAPQLDAEYLADALMASLGSAVFFHQRRARGMALARLKDGWSQLAGAVLGPGSRPG